MIATLYAITVFFMIFLPVVFAAGLRRRMAAPWIIFCLGMLTFAVSQAVHLPLNYLLSNLGILPKTGAAVQPPLWQIALVGGLTAGLCEELARAGGFALLLRLRKSPSRLKGASPENLQFSDGLMAGLGHGGIEAMVFGGILTAASLAALLPLQGADLTQMGLGAEQIQAIQKQLSLVSMPIYALLPLVERLLAMGIHVVFSALVLMAFQKRNPAWVVLAIAYHTLVDAGAVYISGSGWNAWALEGAFFLIALPGYAWLAWQLRQALSAGGQPPSLPVRSEVNVFWTALRKEVLQQVRTRRLLVVAAIFGLFGLTSPLLAYFIPQMLKIIPGAEQFASLVPTPTAADAMVQYIKNLTQFGFILALLLGMGEVAGEKERGTASMVLSKPMTRSAFVLSKFSAQVLVYLLGFALALAGGYFYTVVLFGKLDFGLFGLLNLVLVFWLLPYVAVTLLGSVLGKTTGAAAGFALGGIVLMLVASSIPQIAALMPGALSGWASQLGSQAAGGALAFGASASSANAAPAVGALVTSLVLSLVCILTSIAVFEQQEL